jgi:hypothetical protein
MQVRTPSLIKVRPISPCVLSLLDTQEMLEAVIKESVGEVPR